MKNIYIIRHCTAKGQSPNAQLTNEGLIQAEKLAHVFSEIAIDRIISSPYKRAKQSIEPLAEQLKINIELDERLKERILSKQNLSNWQEKLKASFLDFDLKLIGGESSREAQARVISIIEEVFNSNYDHTILVTHGNLLALLLNYYNNNFGFDEWLSLSNPAVYILKKTDNQITYDRF